MSSNEAKAVTFESLGVVDVLCEACKQMRWVIPTKIQQEVIPVALKGNDIMGIAETGSGKTGAFALPIIQALLEKPSRLFALVLSPTRELAIQVMEQFQMLGSSIKLKCAVLIGGVPMKDQELALLKKPHVIVATPGRLLDHLRNTQRFNLKFLKYLVLDEADQILGLDLEKEVNEILKVISKDRKTYLFSATMTDKVEKLQRASLKDPVKLELSAKYQTVSKLIQQFMFVPYEEREMYLAYLLNKTAGQSIIIFMNSCSKAELLAATLSELKHTSITLHSKMSQKNRLKALERFRNREESILVATNVANRGLDFIHLDCVIIFDLPTNPKEYIHKVGRTARAGRAGTAYVFVTQYDVNNFVAIEKLLGCQIPQYEPNDIEVRALKEEYNVAVRKAKIKIAENKKKYENKQKKNGLKKKTKVKNKH